MEIVHVQRLEAMEEKLREKGFLQCRQMAYATDTGRVVLRTSGGELKFYEPDEDMHDAMGVVRKED